MADHSKDNFEHELEESFKRLDESIRIPEIPDAQSIFERAEKEKTNVLPFKRYSKVIAAAAAVVLVCISVPVFAKVLSFDIAEGNMEPQAPMLMDGLFDSARSDNKNAETAIEEAEAPAEAEMQEDPAEPEAFPETEEDTSESDFRYALETYFNTYYSVTSSGSSSSQNDEMKEHSANSPIEITDELKVISEKLNKKRSIEITVEKDSVSVVLFDNAAGEEVISAFWVEGNYESSSLDEEIYVINLMKTITLEDFYGGYYIPMAGDAINGTYTIPEGNIFVSEEVTKGVINLVVEIDIGTGEYKIHANLI